MSKPTLEQARTFMKGLHPDHSMLGQCAIALLEMVDKLIAEKEEREKEDV